MFPACSGVDCFREGWQDKVEVLSVVDDYVTKPFHIEEVAARMQALPVATAGWRRRLFPSRLSRSISRREPLTNDESSS